MKRTHRYLLPQIFAARVAGRRGAHGRRGRRRGGNAARQRHACRSRRTARRIPALAGPGARQGQQRLLAAGNRRQRQRERFQPGSCRTASREDASAASEARRHERRRLEPQAAGRVPGGARALRPGGFHPQRFQAVVARSRFLRRRDAARDVHGAAGQGRQAQGDAQRAALDAEADCAREAESDGSRGGLCRPRDVQPGQRRRRRPRLPVSCRAAAGSHRLVCRPARARRKTAARSRAGHQGGEEVGRRSAGLDQGESRQHDCTGGRRSRELRLVPEERQDDAVRR